jgi:hypothetical protein
MTSARIVLALAACVAAAGCAARSSPARRADLLTISIEGEAHEMQTFKPVRPTPAARPFLVIRASDVAVLRPPGKYWLHLAAHRASRSYFVLALGYKGDRSACTVISLEPHRERVSAGPFAMQDGWQWHFHADADDRGRRAQCDAIR